MIARIWRGVVASDRAADYAAYIARTGMAQYRNTAGNRAARMLTRELGDGRTEVVTFSLWESFDDIKNFTGEDVEQAVFYPEDDDFLLERDLRVQHYQVID